MPAPSDESQTQPQPVSLPAQGKDHLLLWVVLMLGLVVASIWWLLNQPWAGGSSGVTDPIVVAATKVPQAATSASPVASTDLIAPAADKEVAVGANRKTAASNKPAITDKRIARRVAHLSRNARPLAGNEPPAYPVKALRSGVEGVVLIRAEIDASGRPTDVGYARRSGDRDLDRAALNAVREWRFQPALRNGRAVASAVHVPVDFVLDERMR